MSFSEDGHTEDDYDGKTGQKFAHDVFTLYYPLITELQAAMKAAMEANDPLACACYGADKEATLHELTAHFKSCADPKRQREEPED
jgi:hypothetical protein